MEKHKQEMKTKAKVILDKKISYYQTILNRTFTNLDKTIVDEFATYYPIESYKSYEAYSNTSINKDKRTKVNEQNKSVTMYYMPIFDKDFDFVINPVIIEPVVQLVYQINMRVNLKKEEKKETKQEKEYYFITPSGELKKLDIKN